MTEPDLPDSGMASGSDAGAPGERLRGGDLQPDEQRLLAELQRGVDGAGDDGPDTEAELRAAEDEVPLPAEGGAQDDGLEAEFTAPE